MVDAGLLVYYGVVQGHRAHRGVYDQDDWFTDRRPRAAVQAAVQRRVRPRHSSASWSGYSRCAASRAASTRCPSYSGPPGDMWTASRTRCSPTTSTRSPPAPAPRLDHAAAQAGLLTTRGRLSLDEYNRRARDFSPAVLPSPTASSTTPGCAGTPTRAADELYRSTSAAPALRGRGAGLRRADLPGTEDESPRSRACTAAGPVTVRESRPIGDLIRRAGRQLRRRACAVGRGTHAVVRRVRRADRPAGHALLALGLRARRPGRRADAQRHRRRRRLLRAGQGGPAPRAAQRPRDRRTSTRSRSRTRRPAGCHHRRRCRSSSSHDHRGRAAGLSRRRRPGPATSAATRTRRCRSPTPAAPPAGRRPWC